jgi:predicted neuraminidase
VYKEEGHDKEVVGADSVSLFLRFDPKAKTWTKSGPIRSKRGNIQPSVVELSKDHLLAYCRRGGGYGPGTEGFAVRAESHDGGKTWSEGVDTEFPNPNAAIDLLKLKNGHLLFVYNDSPVDRTPLTVAISTDGGKTWSEGADTEFPNPNAAIDLLKLKNGHLLFVYDDSPVDRTPLTVAISTDGGKTWPNRRVIATGDFDYAYPYAIQGKDGKIRLIYTSHARSQINVATFDEAAIK